MTIIVYIWPDIDIYVINYCENMRFCTLHALYPRRLRTPATGPLFVVKNARIVIEFLWYTVNHKNVIFYF